MSQSDNTLDFRRFFRASRQFWWLYLVSFLVIMGGAVTYSIFRMPTYETTATMLIEDSSDPTPSGGGIGALLGRSFSIGGFGTSSVNNEIYVIDSHDVLMATAKSLKLNRKYILKDGLKKEFLYPESPIVIDAPQEYFDTLQTGYIVNVEIRSDGETDIEFVRGRFLKKSLLRAENVKLPFVSTDPEFPVTISSTPGYESGREYNLMCVVNSYEEAASDINDNVVTEEPDKLSDAIRLTYLGPNKDYNMALLDQLMTEYNNMRVERRRETARREVEFLNQRIAQQMSDLNQSEEKMEQYMASNNLTSIEEEVKLLVEKSVANESTIRGIKTSMEYYRQVLGTLRNSAEPDELLPLNSGATPMIEDYNALITKRKSLKRSATRDNSALKLLDSSIADLKATIEKSTENLLMEREMQLKSIEKDETNTVKRLNEMPSYERQFFNLTRDKELQNQLYLFLIEKRENAMLKYDSNATLGFVVEKAYCALKPSKKKSIIACGAGLILSFLLPGLLIMVWIMWKQGVEGPMDLNFSGLEARTVSINPSDSIYGFRRIRQIMESDPALSTVYSLNLSSSSQFPQQLAASFDNIGRRTEVFVPKEKDNDILLTPSFAKQREDIIREGRLPIVIIPDPTHIWDLAQLMKESGVFLLIEVDKGKTERGYFKNLIKNGIPTQSIVTAILD